jgi:hypothetical protein
MSTVQWEGEAMDLEMKNPWLWTELTEQKKPDRKAGTPVPLGYMSQGADGSYSPYSSWVKKGYVRKVEAQ